nr:MAG TPA: hypothetical protein [Caudoviricetes sp.]
MRLKSLPKPPFYCDAVHKEKSVQGCIYSGVYGML